MGKKKQANYDHLYLTNDEDLGAVASAIRTKGGTEDALTFPDGFVTAIQNIPSGGGGNVKVWDITISEDQPSGDVCIVTDDADAAAHRLDAHAMMVFYPITLLSGVSGYLWVNSNETMGDSVIHGWTIGHNGSNFVASFSARDLHTYYASQPPSIYITAYGRVMISTSSNVDPLKAGTYRLVLTW